mmetsp:Transcript_52742/g.60618  ORF Transcript_52742/g.60618 Transcript_52742/m.60618 type:complete len:169 (+) Transcript_52742:62-568(+)
MKHQLTIFICFALLAVASAKWGFMTPKNSKVHHLSKANITEIAYSTPFVVLFFAPWCPHSIAFRPSFEKFATDMVASIGSGDVDCTIEKELQQIFGVMGYPTVFYFNNGNMYEYMGKRKAADLEAWLDGGYLNATSKPLPDVNGEKKHKSDFSGLIKKMHALADNQAN